MHSRYNDLEVDSTIRCAVVFIVVIFIIIVRFIKEKIIVAVIENNRLSVYLFLCDTKRLSLCVISFMYCLRVQGRSTNPEQKLCNHVVCEISPTKQ